MRKLLLMRPEPGLSASVAKAWALGIETIAVPLFRVEPVDWQPPDPNGYDALLLTSANAVRHGGPGLAALKRLPAHAVGAATAMAAREAGFSVTSVGERGVASFLKTMEGSLRLLHVAGEDRHEASAHVDALTVYRSVPIDRPGLPLLGGLAIAVHSPRAGARLAELARSKNEAIVAAISADAAQACGEGWEAVAVAAKPDDATLLALAARLCHTSSPK